MLSVEVRVEVRPTESERKVKKAVENLLSVKWVGEEKIGHVKFLIGQGEGSQALQKLYAALRKQRILDAARNYLMRGAGVDYVRFYLNKQAAFMGIASFCSFEYGESPLGAITVVVKTDDPQRFIDWLAPYTIDGRPVVEVAPPDP